MIKQGIVQEAMADVSGPTALPPMGSLPQWARINTLDKARYPKPFLKDKLNPVPVAADLNAQQRRNSDESSSPDVPLEITEKSNAAQRIQHLERSIRFLQHQHAEVLDRLHEEIDTLKRQNKELQFRIIMIQKAQSPPESAKVKKDKSQEQEKSPNKSASVRSRPIRKGSTSSTSSAKSKVHVAVDEITNTLYAESEHVNSEGTEENTDELKIIFLEEEIKELKKTLKQERAKKTYLTQLLEQTQKLRIQPKTNVLDNGDAIAAVDNPLEGHPRMSGLPFNATLQPFMVHHPSSVSRPPTIAECEVIMKHLQMVNDRQAHELNQLKSDLRDVLYSHKWTPDAYLLAKAYVAEDDEREAAERDRLPRIQLRQQSRKLPDIAYIQRDKVVLPALKQTMGNKAIERRKRTQILQKARLRREMKGGSANTSASTQQIDGDVLY